MLKRKQTALAIGAGFLLISYCSLPECGSAQPNAARTSLKGKSDEELIALVTGENKSKTQPSEYWTPNRIRPSPLDKLWEMPPRDAALAFVSDYISKEVTGIKLKIDDPTARPPTSGEIGLRWISGNYYAAPEQGLTLLKYDGDNSVLLLSQVQIVGRPSKEEIEQAVLKTDRHPLPRMVAQQTYEILWWLWRVRTIGQQHGGQSLTSSSVDDFGRLWMKPDGPIIEEASFGEPCGECFAAHEDRFMYETFVDTLVRRLIERSGIKPRYPIPKVGTPFYPDDDAKYVSTPPPKRGDTKALRQWIGRLTEILRNSERQYLYDTVMEILVPIGDPLRFNDKRINDALLDVLHRGLAAQSKLKQIDDEEKNQPVEEVDVDEPDEIARGREEKQKAKRAEESKLSDMRFSGFEAAEKLGAHDAVRAFQELFDLAKKRVDDLGDYNRPLIAAASIGARHPNIRGKFAGYLKERLSYYDEQISRGSPLLEAVWRADLRSLAPQLEQIAALPPPALNPSDSRPSAVRKAVVILMAWHETDSLTKAKLDALLNLYIGGASYIPEVLRTEFAALSPQDQIKFRQFIAKLRTMDLGWSLRYLEDVFTPHTPRPDIPYEL